MKPILAILAATAFVFLCGFALGWQEGQRQMKEMQNAQAR